MERAQTKPYFVYMKRFILFVLLIYLIWSFFLNFNLVLSFTLYLGFPVAQMVEHGASNAKIMGSIPRESKSWSNVKL